MFAKYSKILLMKKILVIGNGGRENAIFDSLSRSPQKPILYNFATALNPGISKLCEKIFVGDILNLERIKEIAKEISPDLAIVGPDDPIGAGAGSALRECGIPTFAPTKSHSRLESSKAWTRELLKKYKIDVSPDFYVSTEKNDLKRRDFFDKFEGQIVAKADGLLGGKGVIVADEHFDTFEEVESFAKKSVEKFGRVVLEEKLIGEEFSLMSIVDGITVCDTPIIQDHKRAFEGDTGPQTGGMGCISDENGGLPFVEESERQAAHNITVRVMQAIEEETGEKYVGVMYGGFIITKNGVKLIEYNARFGDPEALNLFPVLETDFVEIVEKATQGKLAELGEFKFKKAATVVKYLCPQGYPTNAVVNEKIDFLDSIENIKKLGGKIYFASVSEKNGNILLCGSRAVGVVGVGENLEMAHNNAEKMITKISGPLFYRKDIGTAELVQKRVDNMKKIRGE
jgi:phosphoribosylamine--glycine ligase